MQSHFRLIEVTDPGSYDLISLEDLELELGLPSDTDDDEQLQARITRTSLMIAELCDRVFRFSEGVETFVFDPGSVTRSNQPLSLKLYPVNAVESITQDGTAVEDFIVDSENGRVWLANATWSGTVVVTYSGGYQLPDDAPAGLQMAVIEAIRERRLLVTEGGGGAIRDTVHGDTRVSYFQPASSSVSGGISPTVQDLIAPFRRLTV
jgi:hypothetical protein